MVGRPPVDRGAVAGARSFGILSTFPPTACGIATFSAALAAGLIAHGATVDVVRCGERRGRRGSARRGVARRRRPPTGRCRGRRAQPTSTWPSCSTSTASTAAATATTCSTSSTRSTVPSVVVAHTVVRRPTAHQRVGARARLRRRRRGRRDDRARADAAWSRTSTSMPTGSSVIPHGATTPPTRRRRDRRPSDRRRPAAAADVGAARAGQGHRVGHRRDGAARRRAAPPVVPRRRRDAPEGARPGRRGVPRDADAAVLAHGRGASVSFDDSYRDLPALTRLIARRRPRRAAVRLRRPGHLGCARRRRRLRSAVVATAFPHAVELLSSGAGVVVPQRDAAALADVVRSVVDRPRAPRRAMAAECRRLAPELSWPAVARRYDELAHVAARRRGGRRRDRARAELRAHRRDERRHRHVRARRARRSRGSATGYCTDDMARVLIAACREPRRRRRRRRARPAGLPLPGRRPGRRRQDPQPARPPAAAGAAGAASRTAGAGRCGRSARPCAGRRRTGCARARPRRSNAGSSNGRRGRGRWPSPRSAPPRSSPCDRATSARGQLLADAVDAIGRPGDDPAWTWPEDRLGYANAALAEALIAAGAAARSPRRPRRRSRRAAVAARPRDRRRSPVADRRRRCRSGRPAADVRPAADRGGGDGRRLRSRLRRDRRRRLARRRSTLSVEWFLGANDVGVAGRATSSAAPATTASRPTASTATRAPSRRSR